MKKSLLFIILIGLFLVGACNLPVAPQDDGISEQEAVAATMTSIVAELHITETAQAGGDVAQPGGDEETQSGDVSPTQEPIIVEDIPWCPAVGYVTHRPGNHEVIYWPVTSMGKDEVVYAGFSDSIYQGEAIVPLDGDADPNTMSLVYFKAQEDAILQWKQMSTIEVVRGDVYKSHLIMAPASDKLAFSVVRQNGSEVYVSSISSVGFAQPLLKASFEGSALDPVRMLLDDAGNLIGLYVTYIDTSGVSDEWYRFGNRLIYIDMSTGEANDILMGDLMIQDVSQTGRLAAVIDTLKGNELSLYEINAGSFSAPIPHCQGCTNAGAALIRPDDGMVAWTEERGADYVLRVADSSGNVTFEMDSVQATELVGVKVDALQAKGWLTSGLLLVDTGFVKNQVFVINVVTGDLAWKSSGNFLSLVYDPELCK